VAQSSWASDPKSRCCGLILILLWIDSVGPEPILTPEQRKNYLTAQKSSTSSAPQKRSTAPPPLADLSITHSLSSYVQVSHCCPTGFPVTSLSRYFPDTAVAVALPVPGGLPCRSADSSADATGSCG
jgi:hypothetical protein